jgi:hypothetical protein
MAKKSSSKTESPVVEPSAVGQPLQNLPVGAARLDLPMLYASGAQIMGTGNDFTLVFTRAVPMKNADDTLHQQAALVVPIAMIAITSQTLKDLSIIISENVPAYEKEFGERWPLVLSSQSKALLFLTYRRYCFTNRRLLI